MAGNANIWPATTAATPAACSSFAVETAAAIRLLTGRARVVAEGAGALALAAALSGGAGAGRIVCIVSGGNIDSAKLALILQGSTP